VVVFLDVALATLESRVHDFESRGLAKRPDETLADLFEERRPLYAKYADIVLQCAGLTHEEVCARIIEGLTRVHMACRGRPASD
jgi:shikimate kinase